MPYGNKWKESRRIFHQEFNSHTTANFLDSQIRHCHTLLRHLYEEPEAFDQHVKHFTSGVILETVYGLEVQGSNDPYVHAVELAMTSADALLAGAYLVDFFPFLKYLPSWLPGTGFKRTAAEYRKYFDDQRILPYQAARKQMAGEGASKPNMITKWMEKINVEPTEEAKRQMETYLELGAAAALIGGYETQSATLLIFIYLMIVHPEVQAKLQTELDAVVGRSRLPDVSDKENLPYVDAVCKEVFRWRPVVPLSIPHRVIAEDEYKGMRIPKGTVIMPNIWCMARDKTVYGPDAESFRPERFLEADLRDPSRLVFGFGRRICPGRYFADNSIFLAVATISHLFKIGKAVDKGGVEIEPKERWTAGLTVRLEDYPCSIAPRFEGVGALLKSTEGAM